MEPKNEGIYPIVAQRVEIINAIVNHMRAGVDVATLQAGIAHFSVQLFHEGRDLSKIDLPGMPEAMKATPTTERELAIYREDRFMKLVSMWILLRDAVEIEKLINAKPKGDAR